MSTGTTTTTTKKTKTSKWIAFGTINGQMSQVSATTQKELKDLLKAKGETFELHTVIRGKEFVVAKNISYNFGRDMQTGTTTTQQQ